MRKQKFGVKGPNAYFSLEACLIMPLVFYCILFVIYAGVYQYDRCLLYQDTYRQLIRGSQVKFSDNEEIAQKMKEEDLRWYYEKYMLCSFGNKRMEVNHGSIRISQDAAMSVSFPTWFPEVGKSWEIHVDATCIRVHPTQVIRDCRKWENVVWRGKKDA